METSKYCPTIENRTTVFNSEIFDKTFYCKLLSANINNLTFMLGVFTSIVCTLFMETMGLNTKNKYVFALYCIITFFSSLATLFLYRYVRFCSEIDYEHISSDNEERNNIAFEKVGIQLGISENIINLEYLTVDKYIKGIKRIKRIYCGFVFWGSTTIVLIIFNTILNNF